MRSVTVVSALAVSLVGAGVLALWFQSEEPEPAPRPAPARAPRPSLPKPLQKVFIKTERARPSKVTIREVAAPQRPAIIPGSLVVRVLDKAKGQPIPGAKVWVAGNPNKIETDAQGRVALPIKPDPKVGIVAFKQGYELVKKASDQVDPRGIGLIIRLEAKATGSIEGEARFDGPAPERFRVLLDSDYYEFPMADGRFRIEKVNVGAHMIGLAVPGKGHGIPLQMVSIQVQEGQAAPVLLTLPRLSRIRGTLVDELGRPVGPGFVKFGRVNVPVSPEGRFDCKIILPGAYQPLLFHRDYGSISAPAMTIEPGEFRDNLTFALTPAGFAQIRGIIEAKDTKLENLRVNLRPLTPPRQRPGGNFLARLDMRRRDRAAYADASGAFRFAHLGPGRYGLSATLPGGQSLKKEVEIRNDEILDIRLVNEE